MDQALVCDRKGAERRGQSADFLLSRVKDFYPTNSFEQDKRFQQIRFLFPKTVIYRKGESFTCDLQTFLP